MRASPGAILAVLSLAAFMAGLDLFIVNVAFDDIGRDFAGASLMLGRHHSLSRPSGRVPRRSSAIGPRAP